MIAKNKKKVTTNDLAANLFGLTKTVDNLARETRSGFAGVDVKIKESEKRIVKEIDAKIDTKIGELALMTKRGFDSVDERFEKVDEKLAEHDNHFTALEMAMKFGFNESKIRDEKLEEKIDKSITLLNGYVKKQESFKQDFTVMKEEMKQVKGVIKNKLGVEIKIV